MKLSKRTLHMLLALVPVAFSYILPPPAGMTASGLHILGIFLGVLTLWLTEAIDWPSLLLLAALAFIPELSFSGILAESIGGTTFSFLLFTFLCTHALAQTPFVRRVALAFVNSRAARRGPWAFSLLFFLSALTLGLFMSPSVLFVIYLPIHAEICAVLNLKKGDRFAAMLMLGMTVAIALSSGMTPIAHVFSNMAMGFYEKATGHTISYAHYIAFGMAVGIITFAAMMLVFRFVLRPDLSGYNIGQHSLGGEKQPMERREALILGVFALVVLAWVVPGFLCDVWPVMKTIQAKGIAWPPLIGAVAMMMISVEGKPLLAFGEGMTKGVSWAALMMTASTLALGAAMTNKDIGLTQWLSSNVSPLLDGLPAWVLVLVFTLWAALQTNVSSNMVTITVVCTVALPIVLATQGQVSAPAVASIIGMMGAFAFATPPAHPNVALAVGSGWTSAKQMLLYGGICMVISVAVTVLVGYPLAATLMGY